MAAAVFSQHSSNPLEVGSSDQRNREYKRRVQREVQNGASEDPANPFSEPNIDKYHRSMAPMFPLYQTLQNKVSTRADGLIDLDEDEDEDMENGHTVVGENDREGTDAEILQDYGVPEVPDYHSDDEFEGELFTDEENTLMLRPTEEREEIEREIHDLEASVPQLDDGYRIVDRLGTGTFSSVYKAVDLRYQQCDNRPWLGQSSHTSSASFSAIASESKAFVAIKRIYVTSNPERIRNEIHILEDCRSCRHVSQIITAFRKDDQVVVIMPYHRNVDFRVCQYLHLIVRI
jgi:cell division control protein 7